MTYQQLKEEENQYVMGTYSRYPLALSHGKGATLWDVEGKQYIDLASGIGVNCLGYAHPKVVEAITQQTQKLMHTSNLYTTAPMIETARTLVTQTGMGKVFFANSGAEANEGAIKLARKYSFDKYGTGRHRIVTLQNSFHGRTVATLSATGQDKFHQYFFPFVEGFVHASAQDFQSVVDAADETTCAIMLELVQGEGGVLPLEDSFVKQVVQLCRQRDLLLLVDEVQTGIGRTGQLFAFQHYGIVPDVVTMAKGLGGGVPIGAVMAAKTCCDVLSAGTHATTFGGTPLACASANAVLSVVTDAAFLADVRAKGAYLQDHILQLHSPHIKGVRGMGLMLAIVVEEGRQGEFVSALMDKGVLALTAGSNAVRLLPPLIISYAELDEAIAKMKEVFA